MDEEIVIIDAKTRNEKIRNFLINNKNKIAITTIALFLSIITYFSYDTFVEKKKIKLADKYNSIIVDFKLNNKNNINKELTYIINEKDKTYSPLALYFLIDNELIKNKEQINNMFDTLIKKTSLDPEIKNLIIYKKALYNSNNMSENELINILNPVINSKSVWKSHGLYLMAEYFYSKNEINKSKEFFQKIISLESSNTDIKIKSINRIKRDFSE